MAPVRTGQTRSAKYMVVGLQIKLLYARSFVIVSNSSIVFFLREGEEGKRLEPVADHAPPPSAKVKDE
jgi:hypothetical protein